MVYWRASLWVGVGLECHIYSLQMTLSFCLELIW